MGKYIINTINNWKAKKDKNKLRDVINPIIGGVGGLRDLTPGYILINFMFSNVDYPIQKRKVNKGSLHNKGGGRSFEIINREEIDEDALLDRLKSKELFFNGASVQLPFGTTNYRGGLISRRIEVDELLIELEDMINKYILKGDTYYRLESFLVSNEVKNIEVKANPFEMNRYWMNFEIEERSFDTFFDFISKK